MFEKNLYLIIYSEIFTISIILFSFSWSVRIIYYRKARVLLRSRLNFIDTVQLYYNCLGLTKHVITGKILTLSNHKKFLNIMICAEFID